MWDGRKGRPTKATRNGYRGAGWGLALSADARLLASSFDGAVKLWDVSSGACLRTLGKDRLCERLDITGLDSIMPANRASLLSLGAVDRP